MFKADPSFAKFNQAQSSNSTFKTEQFVAEMEWLTERQITTHNGYFNNEDPEYIAAKQALLKDIEERDHENPGMAAQGIKQYRYHRGKSVKSDGSSSSETLIVSADVDDKTAFRLKKTFEQKDFVVQQSNIVIVEPWKKAAQDLEKKNRNCTVQGRKDYAVCTDYQS